MPKCAACVVQLEPPVRVPHTVCVKSLYRISGQDYCRHHIIRAAVNASRSSGTALDRVWPSPPALIRRVPSRRTNPGPAQAWLADPTIVIDVIKRVACRSGRLSEEKMPTLKRTAPIAVSYHWSMTAKPLAHWSCPSPALRAALTMNDYSCWTTRINNGGLGFRAFPAMLVAVTWIVDPIIAGAGAEAGTLTATMTSPSTVRTACPFTVTAALMVA